MKTILVPLDGSALAEQVLPYARKLAPIMGARIRLLRVLADMKEDGLAADGLRWAYGIGDPPETHRDQIQHMWDTLRARAEGYLATVAMRLHEDGLDVLTDVRIGPADEIIVEAAQEHQAAMIMMATHGYGGLKRWTLGSITDKVIHTTHTPLFIVRGGKPAPPAEYMLRRILLPLDSSEFARQALPLATELATCADADLVLLEAVSSPFDVYMERRSVNRPHLHFDDMLMDLRAHALQELEALASDLRLQQIAATPVVVAGAAAEAIIDEAELRRADLIVMATHGYSGIKRWALGSVADKVLHAATAPLLLVHAQEREQPAA